MLSPGLLMPLLFRWYVRCCCPPRFSLPSLPLLRFFTPAMLRMPLAVSLSPFAATLLILPLLFTLLFDAFTPLPPLRHWLFRYALFRLIFFDSHRSARELSAFAVISLLLIDTCLRHVISMMPAVFDISWYMPRWYVITRYAAISPPCRCLRHFRLPAMPQRDVSADYAAISPLHYADYKILSPLRLAAAYAYAADATPLYRYLRYYVMRQHATQTHDGAMAAGAPRRECCWCFAKTLCCCRYAMRYIYEIQRARHTTTVYCFIFMLSLTPCRLSLSRRWLMPPLMPPLILPLADARHYWCWCLRRHARRQLIADDVRFFRRHDSARYVSRLPRFRHDATATSMPRYAIFAAAVIAVIAMPAARWLFIDDFDYAFMLAVFDYAAISPLYFDDMSFSPRTYAACHAAEVKRYYADLRCCWCRRCLMMPLIFSFLLLPWFSIRRLRHTPVYAWYADATPCFFLHTISLLPCDAAHARRRWCAARMFMRGARMRAAAWRAMRMQCVRVLMMMPCVMRARTRVFDDLLMLPLFRCCCRYATLYYADAWFSILISLCVAWRWLFALPRWCLITLDILLFTPESFLFAVAHSADFLLLIYCRCRCRDAARHYCCRHWFSPPLIFRWARRAAFRHYFAAFAAFAHAAFRQLLPLRAGRRHTNTAITTTSCCWCYHVSLIRCRQISLLPAADSPPLPLLMLSRRYCRCCYARCRYYARRHAYDVDTAIFALDTVVACWYDVVAFMMFCYAAYDTMLITFRAADAAYDTAMPRMAAMLRAYDYRCWCRVDAIYHAASHFRFAGAAQYARANYQHQSRYTRAARLFAPLAALRAMSLRLPHAAPCQILRAIVCSWSNTHVNTSDAALILRHYTIWYMRYAIFRHVSDEMPPLCRHYAAFMPPRPLRFRRLFPPLPRRRRHWWRFHTPLIADILLLPLRRHYWCRFAFLFYAIIFTRWYAFQLRRRHTLIRFSSSRCFSLPAAIIAFRCQPRRLHYAAVFQQMLFRHWAPCFVISHTLITLSPPFSCRHYDMIICIAYLRLRYALCSANA